MADQSERQGLAATTLQALLLVGQAVTQEQDEDGICRCVNDAAVSLLGASLASVVLTPREENMPRTVFGKVGVEETPLGNTLVGELVKLVETESPALLRFGRVTIVPTATLSPGLISKGITHVARVNVRALHRELGVWIVGKEGSWELGAGEQFALTALANQAAVALENTRLRQALEGANQTLRTMIDHSPLAIISRGQDGKVQSWNPAAERMFGWSEDEVVGHRYPLVPELNLALVHEAVHGAERLRGKKDGSLIDVSIWTAPLRDGSVMVVLDEITERKRAQEVLLQQMQELAVLDERNRLAREIHDSLAQAFTALSQACRRRFPRLPPLGRLNVVSDC